MRLKQNKYFEYNELADNEKNVWSSSDGQHDVLRLDMHWSVCFNTNKDDFLYLGIFMVVLFFISQLHLHFSLV